MYKVVQKCFCLYENTHVSKSILLECFLVSYVLKFPDNFSIISNDIALTLKKNKSVLSLMFCVFVLPSSKHSIPFFCTCILVVEIKRPDIYFFLYNYRQILVSKICH